MNLVGWLIGIELVIIIFSWWRRHNEWATLFGAYSVAC